MIISFVLQKLCILMQFIGKEVKKIFSQQNHLIRPLPLKYLVRRDKYLFKCK